MPYVAAGVGRIRGKAVANNDRSPDNVDFLNVSLYPTAYQVSKFGLQK